MLCSRQTHLSVLCSSLRLLFVNSTQIKIMMKSTACGCMINELGGGINSNTKMMIHIVVDEDLLFSF